MRNINTIEDLYKMLDLYAEGVEWNSFYSDRKRKPPFVEQNTLPDENLVKFTERHDINNALELGCGEGRNAVLMAKHGASVTAVDLSEAAVNNAAVFAEKSGVNVDFRCGNVFDMTFNCKFDFIYDSGMFHHLAPHRRLSYLDLLERSLQSGGYFGLCCFAAGSRAAPETDDYEFYKSRQTGVAFTEERMRSFFAKMFDIIEIRKYENGIPGTIQGLNFMWVCLFRKK